MKKIIFISLIILFFAKTQNVLSKTDAFTVDNIEVSGKIRDQKYKNMHLDKAFRKGFETLISSIVIQDDQKNLMSTDLKTIKGLVASYRIIDESIQDNQYNVKLDVSFDRTLVTRFLFKKKIPYSEVKKLDILVYPITILNSELNITSNNRFFDEWNKYKDFENISFLLPVENLDDINFIKKNLTVLEEIDLDEIVDKYEIKNTAIIIFRFNDNNLTVFLKTNLEGVKKVKKINFGVKNLEKEEVRKSIIRNSKKFINEFWKEENLIDISTPAYLVVNTQNENPESLQKIIEKIENISLIQNYTVERLDKDSAKIKIKFFGKIKNLQNSFIENGLKFKVLHDEWSLYLNS